MVKAQTRKVARKSKKSLKNPEKPGKVLSVVMPTKISLRVGSILFLPFSNDVAAGPPTWWQGVHANHQNEECVVIKIIRNSHKDPEVRIKFKDRYECDINPQIGFIFVRNSK